VAEPSRDESPHSELTQLLKAQRKARENEIYGGLSKQERDEYNERAERIHELDTQLQLIADTEGDVAEQKREWNKESETDTPRSEARQPYGSREEDSTNAFTDFVEYKPSQSSTQSQKLSGDVWSMTNVGRNPLLNAKSYMSS
jgi:hypothetical protein